MGHLSPFCRALALATLSCAVVACTSSTANPIATTPLTSPTQLPAATTVLVVPTQLASADFDQQFIDMMVPHHQGAVEMARIAQTRAQHAEIQKLAGDIALSQSAEVDQMRGWRKAWFGSSETPSMDRMPMLGPMGNTATTIMNGDGTVDMNQQVVDLRAAPEPFDAAFIEAMIPHHQMAVSAARLALQGAKHPEVSQLAVAILDAQQREIGQMQAWRLQWYGSVRANMNDPTPSSGTRPEPPPMQNMPGMMDEGH